MIVTLPAVVDGVECLGLLSNALPGCLEEKLAVFACESLLIELISTSGLDVVTDLSGGPIGIPIESCNVDVRRLATSFEDFLRPAKGWWDKLRDFEPDFGARRMEETIWIVPKQTRDGKLDITKSGEPTQERVGNPVLPLSILSLRYPRRNIGLIGVEFR